MCVPHKVAVDSSARLASSVRRARVGSNTSPLEGRRQMHDAVAALDAAEVAAADDLAIHQEMARHRLPAGVVDEVGQARELALLDPVAELGCRLEQARLVGIDVV